MYRGRFAESRFGKDFLFTFKVTDDITIKKFTNLPRFGAKAGKPNRDYLYADLFAMASRISINDFGSPLFGLS